MCLGGEMYQTPELWGKDTIGIEELGDYCSGQKML